MQYDFLKAFPKRMKTVGLYALLFANSSQKALWRECGFETLAEQLNMIFAVLLYIMEQSLKEEACTMDDISVFVDAVNAEHFRKAMSFDDCQRLADFIVNIVLSNEGRAMYFSGWTSSRAASRRSISAMWRTGSSTSSARCGAPRII